jgi:hypothetical protein
LAQLLGDLALLPSPSAKTLKFLKDAAWDGLALGANAGYQRD